MLNIIPVLIALYIVYVLFFSSLVMYLWNRTIPDVFGFKAISYSQAICLTLLCWILFGAPSPRDDLRGGTSFTSEFSQSSTQNPDSQT